MCFSFSSALSPQPKQDISQNQCFYIVIASLLDDKPIAITRTFYLDKIKEGSSTQY